MADVTKFVVEGDVTLAFYADEHASRRVLLDIVDENGPDSPVASPSEVCSPCGQESLGTKIANEIGFPNDAEFDEFYRKMDELREKGLRTQEGVPDATRRMKMRITVEVL